MAGGTEILFLGTCADDFSPLLAGKFKNRFDKNARRSSSLLIGGKYLIDCGPHCLDSFKIAGADAGGITDLFITHTHTDHFNADNIRALLKGREKPLRIRCKRGCVLPPFTGAEVIFTEFGKEYPLAEDESFFAVDANHDENSFPQHYVFNICGKKLMYACDGAWMLTRSFNRLKNAGLDMLVTDATCGDYAGDYRMAEHNSIPMLKLMMPSFKTAGIIKDETVICLSHIAPSLHAPHDEIQKSVDAFGWKVAYDGLKLIL